MEDEKLKLYAPDSYWNTPAEDIDAVTGGCGPGGVGDFLVPDTIWFLNIKIACRIHDWMYAVGETESDKIEADRVFLINMRRLVKHFTKNKILRAFRNRRARTYYLAVKHGGDEAFWGDKIGSTALGMVEA